MCVCICMCVHLTFELKELVNNCQVFLKYSISNHIKPGSQQHGQEMPFIPWSKHATDLFHFENSTYLLVVDYYSRFPVIQ